jgi:hypothetical protein
MECTHARPCNGRFGVGSGIHLITGRTGRRPDAEKLAIVLQRAIVDNRPEALQDEVGIAYSEKAGCRQL